MGAILPSFSFPSDFAVPVLLMKRKSHVKYDEFLPLFSSYSY